MRSSMVAAIKVAIGIRCGGGRLLPAPNRKPWMPLL
jgi:hypothetical protein